MARNCPSCGNEAPDDARFRPTCGAELTATAAPTGGCKERKYATALFADLVGSTAMAEAEDPEVVERLIGDAFERLSAEVERYGGLLEKFIGDALLAVFGVPSAHEDDPERAVRAGLEMHAVLSELNRGFASAGRPQLAMRIGIEAGDVLVDLERATGARERMLTGDAVNVAARLQSAAEPGATIVGPAAYAATKTVIDYRELAPLTLKGKAAQVQAWQALRVKARRRGERVPLGLEARLIGRDEELSVLKQTLHRVESEGRPALVTIFGAAGVGKSRLTSELLKYVEGLPGKFYWRRGRCLAYGGVSYSALAEAIKAQCEVLEDDPPDVVARKVGQAVEELFGDRDVVPELLALVGAGEERTFAREELFDAWRRFLERMAGRYPLVLALEDIHWADAGLLDFIDHLVDWAVGPILVVTLARPELLEVRPAWGGGKRNYSGLYLDPLAPSENEAMLDDLLPADLPVELKREIVERSEGNPLFTEEIVRMLIDRGVLRATSASRWEVAAPVAEIDLPRSIHGLIAARLDTLPPDEKATLQDASVIGRIFWSGAVGRLANGEAPQQREVLGRLRVKELIVPREPPAFSGEMEFGFRHVLIRDVAYDSLPKAARAAKHAAVARWAEERAGERREELAELIATHYAEALRFEREVGVAAPAQGLAQNAFEWARTAGERSLRLWQRQEAVRWFRQALDLAEAVSASEEAVAVLWESYARALTELAPWTEVIPAYKEALGRYEALGRGRDAGRVEGELAQTAFNSGRDEEVLPLVERALVRLEPFGDSEDLASVLHVQGWYHFRRGNADLIETPVRRSIEMARRLGAQAIEADGLVTLGSALAYRATGYAEGTALLEAGYQLSREVGSMLVTVRAANNLAALTADSEVDLSRLEAILDEAIELAQRIGAHALESWLLGNLGYVLVVEGRLDQAESAGARSLELAREMDEPPGVALRLLVLARVLIERGDVDRAEPLWAEAVAIARTNPESQTFGFAGHLEGLIALGRGRKEDALPVLRAALDRHGDFQYSSAIATDLIGTLAWSGDDEEARSRLAILAKRAAGRPATALRLRWLEAVLEEDPHAAEIALTEVVAHLTGMHRPIDRARAMIDLAVIRERNGHPGAETLAEAEAVLEATGARLYLVEVERARREMAGTQSPAPVRSAGRKSGADGGVA